MPEARSVIEQIGRSLQSVNKTLLQHPYLDALAEGRIPAGKLTLFAGEQHITIRSDLKSVAYLVSRSDDARARDFFLGVLQGERQAADSLLSFASALGWGESDLRGYDPMPGAQAYTCGMAWLALNGTPAEVAAAYLVNFPAWGESCGRMARTLRERLGFRDQDVAFFDLFASPQAGFEQAALEVIQGALDRGAEERSIWRAASLLQGYELMFWNTMYEASVES